MSDKELIKTLYLGAAVILLICGVIVIVEHASAGSPSSSQQNANSQNMNSNSNNRDSSRGSGQNANTTAKMDSQDRNFVNDAAMAGMMEVALGNLAAQKGSSDAIKQFGQRMVDDHSKANTELAQLVARKGMTRPTALGPNHRNEVDKMSKLSGAEFDRAYAKAMVKNHSKSVSTFEKESTKGSDSDLKAFAAKTLPTIQEHLQMAKALPGNEDTKSGMDSNSNRP